MAVIPPLRALAGINVATGVEGIFFALPKGGSTSALSFPEGDGFLVSLATENLDEVTTNLIVLQRREGADLSLFVTVCEDLLQVLNRSKDQDSFVLLQVLVGRIRAWQEFMRRGVKCLGERQELGIIGELLVLERLLSKDWDSVSVLRGWTGPNRSIHDFSYQAVHIEVKTSLAEDSNVIRVASLDQLEPPKGSLPELFLFQVCLAPSLEGVSLLEIVGRLHSDLAHEPLALCLFEDALLSVGLNREAGCKYSLRVLETALNIYKIDEDFPSLHRRSVHASIAEARYRMCLDGAVNCNHELENVLSRINDGFN